MASSLTHLHPQYPFQEPASKSILIDLDQAGWIFTRSTITGTVTITYDENEQKNYRDSQSFIEANTPLLHILGEEKIHTVERFHKMKDKKRVNIIRQLIPLEMKKHRKHDGKLIFTFEKEIPNDLPSSTEVHLGMYTWYQIFYKLKASIPNNDKSTEVNMTIIHAPPDNEPFSHLDGPQTTVLQRSCAIKGEITYALFVNDTQVGKGEHLTVSFSARNNSKIEIKAVEIVLRQFFSLTGDDYAKDEVAICEFRNVGVFNEPGHCLENGADQQKCEEEVFESVMRGDHKVDLKVPTSFCNTYKSSLVNVEHQLEIHIITPFKREEIEIDVPIKIVSSQRTVGRKKNYDWSYIELKTPPHRRGKARNKHNPQSTTTQVPREVKAAFSTSRKSSSSKTSSTRSSSKGKGRFVKGRSNPQNASVPKEVTAAFGC